MDYETIVSTIESYWDDRAATFDKDHDTEDIAVWQTVLAELLGPKQRQTVLDLGVGTGFLANMLARAGHSVAGVDISVGMMEYGVRHSHMQNAPVFYLQGDAKRLPFLDNSVDAIVNARLIWTIAEPEEMLREWHRVLKPGGRVICLNRMKDDHGMTKWHDAAAYADEAIDAALSLQTASFEKLVDALQAAGFEEARCDRLPAELTRAEFGYDRWYALVGNKPNAKTFEESMGLAAYWNESSDTYDERHELHDAQHWMHVLSNLVGENKDARILDVATGTGMMANFLASAGYTNVVGVDIAEKMMRHAMKRAEELGNDIEFLYGNTLDLPFDAESFDVVINSRLLWTLTDPGAAISEWHRVLKPGGRVIAINELEDSGIETHTSWGYEEKTGVSSFPFGAASREEIIKTFEDAGFSDTAIQHMEGCHMETSERENWFAFVGDKN